MRFGVGVGPFYASTSTRRRKGEFPIIGTFFVLVLLAALAYAFPWEAGGVALVVVALVARAVRRGRAHRAAAMHHAVPVVTVAAPDPDSAGERLRALEESYRAGYFNDEEYRAARKRILSEPSDPPPTVEP